MSTTKAPEFTNPLARCRPRGDRVVIKRDKPKQESAGGILLPDTSTGRQQTGEVWSVGPGKRNDKDEIVPLGLRKGDRVIISSYAGNELSGQTEDFVIVSESEIMADLE